MPRSMRTISAAAIALVFALLPMVKGQDELPSGEQLDFFERKVRPLFARRCYACHSEKADEPAGDLLLDSAASVRTGGFRGPAILPGKPAESLVIRAVRRADPELAMPPSAPLAAGEVAVLEEWVRSGGHFPEHPAKRQAQDPEHLWSFRPPRRQPLPLRLNASDDALAAWPLRRLDWFVLDRLIEEGLDPAPVADRRTLIRRLTFHLTGLPPTREDVLRFVDDDRPDAYARLVGRLLSSPQYGERWGRFWLDLARYTDTTASWLKSTGDAWRYRDWVVTELNADLPYDEFVRRQLAADLMAHCEPADLAALGFLGLSPTYWKELRLAPSVIRVVAAEEWDERIDAVTRTFLGLTVACARCHDHKFDAVSMEDYYALAGVFASTQLVDRPLLSPDEASAVGEVRKKLEKLEAARKAAEKEKNTDRVELLRGEIETLQAAHPNLQVPVVNAVEDGTEWVRANGPDATKLVYEAGVVRDLPVFLRGDPGQQGTTIARRFLGVLGDGRPPEFRDGSGRRELAEAIFREGRPLASRVIVNRIWRQHFGEGLVTTPSNFGVQGELPSHPRLLDDLAARFIENGWSLKWLHREILMSATFRQSAEPAGDPRLAPDGQATAGSGAVADPRNRLLWKMNRQRLSIEQWRDAMLRASGRLDLRMGGAPFELADATMRRRTIYGRVHRRDLNHMLRLYDFPEPTSHSPGRELTTTPLQQLFLFNSDFVAAQADSLARRSGRNGGDHAARIERLYQLVLGRRPTQQEFAAGAEFVADGDERRWTHYAHALLGLNEMFYLD